MGAEHGRAERGWLLLLAIHLVYLVLVLTESEEGRGGCGKGANNSGGKDRK